VYPKGSLRRRLKLLSATVPLSLPFFVPKQALPSLFSSSELMFCDVGIYFFRYPERLFPFLYSPATCEDNQLGSCHSPQHLSRMLGHLPSCLLEMERKIIQARCLALLFYHRPCGLSQPTTHFFDLSTCQDGPPLSPHLGSVR